MLFGPLPACTPRLGQTQMWQGVCVPLQVFPLGTHFLLRPGGRRITASSRGGLTLSLQPLSPLGPGLSPPSWGVGQFHLSLGLRLAQPATALSPAVRAAKM